MICERHHLSGLTKHLTEVVSNCMYFSCMFFTRQNYFSQAFVAIYFVDKKYVIRIIEMIA